MQIKHMPCGTHHFADVGYERYPYQPVRGDRVMVQVRLDDAVGSTSAVLHWTKAGHKMPSIQGKPLSWPNDNRPFFAFDLGEFDELCQAAYTIEAQDEVEKATTKTYRFEVLGEEPLGGAKELRQGKSRAYAVFERVAICLDWSDGLKVEILPVAVEASGEAVESVQQTLGDQLSISIQKQPFVWQLKRSSKTVVEVQGEAVRLLVDRTGAVHRLTYRPTIAGQHLVGFGERFDTVDQMGKELLCRIAEKFTRQGENSYLPIPFFMTDAGLGWFSSTQRRLWFDGRDGVALTFETDPNHPHVEEWWLVGKPQELLGRLHDLTGRAALPPKWAFGIWISANGWNTQQETMEQLEALARYQLPATVMVLEAWSDEHTFCIFNDAEYDPLSQDRPYTYGDFRFPQGGKWPDPKAMAEAIKDAGLNLVLWQIPVIKYTPDACQQLQEDEAYALANGYCVMNDDGTPYRLTDHWFGNSLLLDFTNPAAVKWWFSKREYLVKELNVKGFKTDGGEFLFDDTAIVHNGQTGATAHNTYPGHYIKAYHDFFQELGVEGVTFSRAGFTGAQTQPIHWAGDQLSEWSEFRAQLTAGLSAGLSGIPFWSFDIGGFAGDFPTPELYLRATAMAAFCPVMQWHAEPRSGQFYYTDRERWVNDRSPWNLASLYNDPSIIHIYRKFANLRMNLLPYIYSEAIHCAKTARPLMAHLLIDWPEDPTVWEIHDQYMFGRDLLVAPIVYEGANQRTVYLPEGMWHNLFQGGTVMGGRTITYTCPMDEIPVFVRDGSAIPINLNEALTAGTVEVSGGVGNDTQRYTQLAFLCFGSARGELQDDLGNRLVIEDGRVRGTGPITEVLLVDMTQPGSHVQLFGRGCSARRVLVSR